MATPVDVIEEGTAVPSTIVMRYQWDAELGAWSVTADGLGRAALGPTLAAAHERARDAVRAWLGTPDDRSPEDAGVTIVDIVVSGHRP